MESKTFKEIKKVVNTIKIFNNKFIIYMVMNEFNKLYDLKELNDKLYNYLTKDIKLTDKDIKNNIKFLNIVVNDDIKEEDNNKRGRKKKFKTSYYERHKETIKENNLKRYYYNKSKSNNKEDIKEDIKEDKKQE